MAVITPQNYMDKLHRRINARGIAEQEGFKGEFLRSQSPGPNKVGILCYKRLFKRAIQ